MKRFCQSVSFALNGIRIVFQSQKNATIQVTVTSVVCVMGWQCHISALEWTIVSACIGMVIAAECFNTAIEYMVDFISPQYHLKAGQIKDLAAGGVLILSLTTVIIGLIIFLPKLLPYF